MEKSYLFTSHAETTDGVTTYDRALTASQMRAMNKALIGSGVYADPATTLKVSATSGMTVSVAAGKAWVEGAYYELDEAMTFTVTTASGTNKRIDTLVLRFDDSDATRAVNLVLVTGTADASAAPTAPVREGTTYDIVLAQITVAKGVTSITAADIKDTRFDNDLCGQVTGVLNQITTTGLFTQYQGQFETWFANIKNQLSTDAAGNLQVQIDVLQTALDSANTALTNYKAEVTAAQALREQIINARLDSDRVYKFDHFNIPFNTAWKNGLKSTDWGALNSDGSVTFKKAGWYFCAMNIHCSDVPGYTGTFHIRLFYGTGGGNISENYVATNTATNSAHHMVSGAVSAIAYFNVGDVLRNEICGASMDYNYRIDYENSSLTVAPHAFV